MEKLPAPQQYLWYQWNIKSLDDFTYEIGWPTAQSNPVYCIKYLDGVLIRHHKCDCQLAVLMQNGCQCGGV